MVQSWYALSAVFSRGASRIGSPLLGLRVHPNGWPVLHYSESPKRHYRHLAAHRLPRLIAFEEVGEYRLSFPAPSKTL